MRFFKKISDHARARHFYYKALHRHIIIESSPKHGLPGELIVSLTSYIRRFNTLEATIRCLLSQSVSPDVVLLWIGKGDFSSLPGSLKKLCSSRFIIERTSDIRSYTKIIPCLERAPKAFIVTCDDDVYYPENWLETLVSQYELNKKIVPCSRAHKIKIGDDGNPLSYEDWELETASLDASTYIFPTGVGGVLYEPGVFYSDVTKTKIFQELCPTADDVWLYWMASINGRISRTTARQNKPITWPYSQRSALRILNMPRGGGNDTQIHNMLAAYGQPFTLT